MKVSFIIPAHNEAANIPDCIRSIQAEILRTHCDAEIIVANNASTDDTEAAARAMGSDICVINESRKSVVWARQAGYEASTGDLIANIDADNRLPVGWLDVVLKTFTDPHVAALSGPYIYYDLPFYMRAATRIFYIGGYIIDTLHRLFGVNSMLQGGNFVLRRSTLEAMGGYDTSIEFYGEDTDTGRRAAKVGKVIWTFKLPIYSSGRRIREEGLLHTGLAYAINFFTVTYGGKPVTTEYKDIRNS